MGRMVAKSPQFWYKKGWRAWFFLPFSALWWAVSWLRTTLYTPYKSADCRVIIVGGCVAGGSGKTPFVRLLRHEYQQSVILVKSYQKNVHTHLLKPDNDNSIFDEAMLHASDGDTIICDTRRNGIKLAESLGYKTIICDDGMQDPTIQADSIYLVIDGHSGFGNGWLMPAGPNRQSPTSALGRANEIVQINGAMGRFAQDGKNYRFYRTKIAQKPDDTAQYLAFCGLAIPQKFYESALQAGYNIMEFMAFADHYRYQPADFERIIQRARQLSYRIITTQKDYVKIPAYYQCDIECLSLNLIREPL